jgi:TRAP-type C4-dicarboxylate transport system substrate-binding protein
MDRFPTLVVTGAATLSILLGGCQSASKEGDKAGTTIEVLTLASIDAVNNNGMSYAPQEFIDAIDEVSDGRLRAQVDLQTFSGAEPDAESSLVRAIAAGQVEGGWPSTRAFAGAGVQGLEVVEAPFTLTSYAAVGDFVSSPVASTLLERLEGSGVVGLGLAVGPLRRPLATHAPLLGTEDWDGVVFRSYNSPVQDAVITALGGRPEHVTYDWPTAIRSGNLDALEFDVAQYHHNGMTTEAGQITGNVVLWPKVFVLALSQEVWDELNSEQQGWVRVAAQRAVTASIEGPYDEAQVVRELCRSGAQVHLATPAQVDSLRDAVAPVLTDLAQDPVLREIRAIGARHGLDALDPERCRPTVAYRQVPPKELHVPDTPSSLPDGVYRVEIDREDVIATGIGPPAEGITGVWTLTVAAGRYTVDCTPLRESTGIDCTYGERLPRGFDMNPREVGRITGDDTVAYFSHDMAEEERLTDCTSQNPRTPYEACFQSSTNRVSWTLNGDQLTFTDMVADEPAFYYIAEPWRRIG